MKQICPRMLALALALASAAPAAAPAADAAKPGKHHAAAADDLFTQLRVLSLKIEISESALEVLKTDPRKYVKAALTEGSQRYADIGVRLKGHGSFQPIEKKPGFALKFNEYTSGTRFHGETKLLLNNAGQDPTCLCEALGGEIFRAAGVPAPKVTFARVELNGRDLGLYALVEAVNHDFLSRYFKNAKGNLYEGVNNDITDKLEKDSGDEPNDQADLKALAAAAKEPNLARRFEKLSGVLDLDRFISFAAVEVLAGHHDGYSMDRNNFRVYHEPGRGLITFIPHGYDQLFDQPNIPPVPEWKGLVAKALLETPEGQRRYRERMGQLLTGAFDPSALQTRIQYLAAAIRSVAVTDPSRGSVFDAAVKQLGQRIKQRAQFVQEELKKTPGPAARPK